MGCHQGRALDAEAPARFPVTPPVPPLLGTQQQVAGPWFAEGTLRTEPRQVPSPQPPTEPALRSLRRSSAGARPLSGSWMSAVSRTESVRSRGSAESAASRLSHATAWSDDEFVHVTVVRRTQSMKAPDELARLLSRAGAGQEGDWVKSSCGEAVLSALLDARVGAAAPS
eukprot:TRINITY_DN60017_c0_g1_i1.p1 TRINITY_DN60017_c0_g1~~TRINITY_DN60017_c0_g1_i1.p1  ORF type:complete len:199 (+),score=42.28 TRINITY_DN60017_c0_g1_i1:88-597(+)